MILTIESNTLTFMTQRHTSSSSSRFLQDSLAEEVEALNKLNQVAQERMLEEEKSHASSREQAKADSAALQSEISELQINIEALEANLGGKALLVINLLA